MSTCTFGKSHLKHEDRKVGGRGGWGEEREKGLQMKQEITLTLPYLPPAPTHMTYLVNVLYLSEQMFFIQMCRIQVSSYAFSLLS